ncbi:MAG TPA: M36 family metallopeptidase [Pyrinomonadaceae bacterium]
MKRIMSKARRSILLSIFVLALATTVVLVPTFFHSSAGNRSGDGLFERTTVHEEGLDYYDIRTSKADAGTIMDFRQSAGNALRAAELRSRFVDAEGELRRSIPTLKIEYNPIAMVPELIAPDVLKGRAVMTGPSSEKRSEILRNFAKTNSDLVGVTGEQIDQLKVTADYTNPDGNLSFASLEQFIDDVPVFRGEIKAGFTRRGEMFRVVNNLASGLDYGSLRRDFGDPANAVRIAAANVRADVDMTPNAESTDLKAVFGGGPYPTTASKYYFPIETGLVRAAWYVVVWKPINGYEVIVDAESGKVLWRQNMGKDQTQAATYNVWANTTSFMLAMDSPAPLSPGPIDPAMGTQGTLQPRTMVTLIGNEAPNTFNNNGWITDGTNALEGNNTQAGLDRASPGGPDLPIITGSPNRVFNFAANPPPGNPGPGDNPLPDGQTVTPCAAAPPAVEDKQRAAVTYMFYVVNRLHDVLYRHGFTEQARNFQLDNFGRGGSGNDRVLAEGQDCSGTNNANFNSTSTDGTVGRMQMYIFVAPTPDRDGTLDGDVIIHEIGHGVTNRLHTGGISGTQGSQMHEGNGDFLAHVLLSEPTDPVNGVYSMGGYATYFWRVAAPFANAGNYYYGIRRFPKAVIGFTGGPLNRPHNPLTYADIDPAQFNVSNSAFGPAFTGSPTQAHDGGEVWSSMLWEVRARLVTRLGHTDGTSKMIQLMLDGMKLATSTSSMLNSRNSILAAAQASGTGADVADVWAGFAARGMGFNATNPTGNTVVESFGLPNLLQTPTITVSDAAGDNDGFPEPGEQLAISVPLSNSTGSVANNVTLQLVGGGSANYGTINHGASATQVVSYTVPAVACGSAHTLTFNVDSNLGATSFARPIIIGKPLVTFTENFDGATAPAFPAGWTAASVQSGINFVTTTNNVDSGPNAAFALDPATVGGGTNLTSPSIPIASSAAVVEFRNRYDTEGGWDGGVLEISIGGGAFQDVITAGGVFIQNGYNSLLGSNGVNNPLAGRSAWSGNSNGYLTSSVRLPAVAAGQNIQLRFRFGADDNTVGQGPNPGWYIDNLRVIGNYECDSNPPSVRSRADFDGDGKTDVSVFRPSEGNWYLNRSTDGFTVANWGLSTDIQTPGDFDGDGKADTAVFRPSTGTWWILRSSGGIVSAVFGTVGDVPVVGDYDGNGSADIAVFRPSNNTWYIQHTGGGAVTVGFGAAGDLPVRGDYNGDGSTDIAVFRPSTGAWWIANSGGGVTSTTFGLATDKPVPADYDGDSKDDIAVYRPSTGTWYILKSTNGAVDIISFGISTDIPVPGDYDGDGRDDQAIYRNGTWWLNRSTAGVAAQSFGLSTDVAVPSRYIP